MNKGGVQQTGEDLGRLTVLAAPAADGWRWAQPSSANNMLQRQCERDLQMKNLLKLVGNLLGTLVLIALAVLLIVGLRSTSPAISRQSPLPTPTSVPQSPIATPTPVGTPSIFNPPTPSPLPQNFVPPSPVISTATVYIIQATVDLSPTLPLEQKSEIIVSRIDGTYIKYLAPPDFSIDDIPLQQGDVVVQVSSPPANFGKNPLPASPTAISTVAP